MNRLFDLRFVIGAFFISAGMLLLVYALFFVSNPSLDINCCAGLAYLLFGGIMVFISFRKEKKADS